MAVSSKRDICNKIIKVQKIGIFVFALLGLEAKYGPSAAVELDFRLNNSLQPIPKNLNLIGSYDYKLSQNISLRSLQSQVPAQIVDLKAEGTQSLKNPVFAEIRASARRAH